MIEKSKILENLKKIGFKRKEAQIFLELVKNPGSNGSQLAKLLGYPRTSIYQNLDIMVKKQYINSYLNKGITLYKVANLKEVLEKNELDINRATKFLKSELDKFEVNQSQKQFYNLNSFDEIREKIKNNLKKAKKIVYISTNLNLFEFEKELKEIKKAGVRIILFTSNKVNYSDLELEIYLRNFDNFDLEERVMIVVDLSIAIISSFKRGFCGIYSENKLLVNIVTEHIKNNIHLIKLEYYKKKFKT